MLDMRRYSAIKIVESLELRFKDVANLEGDFSLMPMPKEYHLQVATDKAKSDSFGEVFTPIWLVDSMLERVSDYDWRNGNKVTLDLCAGYGQFTIRMIRKKFELLGEKFDIKSFLFETHYFSELQLSSCHKLLHIYSPNINLFIGDSKELKSLPENCSGIYYYNKEWIECTEQVKEIFGKPLKKYSAKAEAEFVAEMEKLTSESSQIALL
jgi:type I restriction-modification system DNA methylase subunit